MDNRDDAPAADTMIAMTGALHPDELLDLILTRAETRRPQSDGERWRSWWQRCHAELGDDSAARLAARQGFVLTRAQARRCGHSEPALRRLVAHGEWTHVLRGVLSPLAVPPAPDGDRPAEWLRRRRVHALRAAASALIRPGQVISGRSATILHGLPTLAVPRVPELTAAAPTTLGHRPRAHVWSATLVRDDITTWFGAPVTRVSRTVVDSARHDRRDGLIGADAALHDGLTTMQHVDRALGQARGWPGVRRAGAVLALASPLAESPLESLVRLAICDAGLPMPELQVAIGEYRVDMLWPEQRVIVEADGRTKYTGDELWREKVRQERLARLGYRIVRVLWQDIMPARLPATIARLRAELTASSPV